MHVQLIDEIVFDVNVDVSRRIFHFEYEYIYLKFIKYLPKIVFARFVRVECTATGLKLTIFWPKFSSE